MIRYVAVILLQLVSLLPVYGQWDFYQATWEGEIGIVSLNMGWIQYAPVEDLEYVIQLKLDYPVCDENGQPGIEMYDRGEEIHTSVYEIFNTVTFAEHVGTFMHQCSKSSYHYVRDTIRVRDRVAAFLSASHPDMTGEVKILHDPKWKVYSQFLYPDEFLIQSIYNRKMIDSLIIAGVDINAKRKINHRASFYSDTDRKSYRVRLLEQNFAVDSLPYDIASEKPYIIHFSRKDRPLADWITDVTHKLSIIARQY